ncbi:hypothetical protein II906_05345 [bacterium]|nr:hypothetical protein [bacterium]
MKWFQIKEHSAGEKRLLLSWYLYKIFGKKMLYFIAFFVAFFTFIFAKDIRFYSKKYLTIMQDYINIKPSLLNQFMHIYSYANALADKILLYAGDFDSNNLIFDNENDKAELFKDINAKKGVFFICNHIGNIEVLQAFLLNRKENFKINIFLSRKQSTIFNSFLDKIKVDMPVKLFPVEDTDVNTGIELKESLSSGNVVFIAGDRLAEANDKKNIEKIMYNHKLYLPKGTYKLAKLMEAPVYFISAIKEKNKYKIYIEKQKVLSEKELADNNIIFMKKMAEIAPLQFYHFYDFFL